MNAPGVSVNPGAMAAVAASQGRGFPVKNPGQEEAEHKEISTEQIQAMLDENSSLIVEIIGLNNQIKHGKGTAQLGEFTDKLDKKRKKLNKNLMTLAKWADESSDQPPRPMVAAPPTAYVPPANAYAAARSMPMQAMPPPSMAMNHHPQMRGFPSQQVAQQLQAQALAQAQYHARMSSMGYGGMAPQASVPTAAQPHAPRYHDPSIYGAATMNPMAMGGMPGYVGGAAAAAAMGYAMPMPHHSYGMMAPAPTSRMAPGGVDGAPGSGK